MIYYFRRCAGPAGHIATINGGYLTKKARSEKFNAWSAKALVERADVAMDSSGLFIPSLNFASPTIYKLLLLTFHLYYELLGPVCQGKIPKKSVNYDYLSKYSGLQAKNGDL
jgi:hypothetical protein